MQLQTGGPHVRRAVLNTARDRAGQRELSHSVGSQPACLLHTNARVPGHALPMQRSWWCPRRKATVLRKGKEEQTKMEKVEKLEHFYSGDKQEDLRVAILPYNTGLQVQTR